MSDLGLSVKEDLKKIVQALPQLAPKELLSYWINTEAEEAEIYYKLYKLSKELELEVEISEVFYYLYEDSLKHAEKLLKVYKGLFPEEEIPKVNLPSLKIVWDVDKLSSLMRRGDLEELFDILLENKKIIVDIYEYLLTVSEEPEMKEIFQWLAGVENGHYAKLKTIRERYLKGKTQTRT
ncbi:ferritin family protein [Thermococcus argininiproducens]|uniref:Ferritin family protein n=1 Tax=Thermococcus argininiproducens TaxID=2866384 RepID=A0A9E7M803_9EURY|nr:ferritin family protein [Thermococcus argininiproducens]USG99114.1 ferritin family protein [Thermococcus argininiproducens]